MVNIQETRVRFPSSAEEGWLRDQEKLRSIRITRRRGGGGKANRFVDLDQHHPVRSVKGGCAIFFLMSRPPLLS